MASNYIGLPATGPIDPTNVVNSYYQYKQATLVTFDNVNTEIHRDQIERDGVYLYELRVIGVQSATANAAFKRSFTVYRTNGTTSILAVQSDYTFKTNAGWGLSISSDGDVIVSVIGDTSQPVNWVLSLTKTMGF